MAEIAYTLGFTEPTHFNNFFKNHPPLSPPEIQEWLKIHRIFHFLPKLKHRFIESEQCAYLALSRYLSRCIFYNPAIAGHAE